MLKRKEAASKVEKIISFKMKPGAAALQEPAKAGKSFSKIFQFLRRKFGEMLF